MTAPSPGTIVCSVLTLILLVVLGGGVGLLAVTLAESPKPATDGGASRRAPKAGDDHSEEESGARRAPAPAPVPVPSPAPPPRRESRPEPTPAPSPVAVAEAGPPRRSSRGDVPKAFTAVEGRLQDVARAPLWRRLVSLVLIVVIAVGVGAAIAAIAAAIIGAAAEILGNTIG